MKLINKLHHRCTTALLSTVLLCCGCTKYEKGFLSPYIQYPLKTYTVIKGRASTTDGMVLDGSSLPVSVKILHVYDVHSGKLMDSIFFKKYTVQVWNGSYDAAKDTTLDMIKAKQSTLDLEPLHMNEQSGSIEANTGTLNLPAGDYNFDIQVTNIGSTEILKRDVVSITLVDGVPFEEAPGAGSVANQLFLLTDENVVKTLAKPIVTIKRVADKPNQVTLQLVDKNGVPFNPLKGEIVTRINGGLNPIPPTRPNLGDYTRTYQPTDTSIVYPFSMLPIPLASASYGYNYYMYYRIPTKYAHSDGYPDDLYTVNPRFPVRIWLEGSYTITVKMPDVTHR
ncbi:DUF5007 domain-containing protein [Deminuibacter soli]|uniref:DUF5007 domain-containing protein n=1 Tax=Deminuibacter soli TaxID=2291815 RepID=A0A3E1NIV0_9BACT|nr:DUF5007 domain-containing protein [Deminuibacter soli]RFM27865.1 DUF5007 domain-containing protein [Deminuibacter soli]